MGKKKQKRRLKKPKNAYHETQTKESLVEEEVTDDEREISLEDARRLSSLLKLGTT